MLLTGFERGFSEKLEVVDLLFDPYDVVSSVGDRVKHEYLKPFIGEGCRRSSSCARW